MSLTGTTSRANELAALRTIPRAANWVALPEALSSQGVFGAYPPGSENYSFGAPYVHWTQPLVLPSGYVTAVASLGTDVYAVDEVQTVWKSADGMFWRARPYLPYTTYAYGLLFSAGGVLYAGVTNTGGYIYGSSDGKTWAQACDGHATTDYFKSMCSFGGKVYAGSHAAYGSLASVRDNGSGGSAWNICETESTDSVFFSLCVFDGVLYAGTGTLAASIHYSADGAAWTRATPFTSVSGLWVLSLVVFSGAMYALVRSTAKWTVWKTSNGVDWTQVYASAFASSTQGNLFCSDAYLYCVTSGVGNVYAMRSADGTTWEQLPGAMSGICGKGLWLSPYLVCPYGSGILVVREL